MSRGKVVVTGRIKFIDSGAKNDVAARMIEKLRDIVMRPDKKQMLQQESFDMNKEAINIVSIRNKRIIIYKY